MASLVSIDRALGSRWIQFLNFLFLVDAFEHVSSEVADDKRDSTHKKYRVLRRSHIV